MIEGMRRKWGREMEGGGRRWRVEVEVESVTMLTMRMERRRGER